MQTNERPKKAGRPLLLTLSALLGVSSCDMQMPEGEEEIEVNTQALLGNNQAWPKVTSSAAVGANLITDTSKFPSKRLLAGKKANFPGFFGGLVYLFGNNYHQAISLGTTLSSVNSPTVVKTFDTGATYTGCSNPDNTPWEAEAHQSVFLKRGAGSSHTYHVAVYNGRGVDIFDVTNMSSGGTVTSPSKRINVSGVCWGDVDNSIWGLGASGNELWIGATNQGLHRVNWTTAGTSTSSTSELGTSSMGGMKAGPLYILGDRMMMGTPKRTFGHVVLNIANPTSPTVMDRDCGSSSSCVDQDASASGQSYWWQLYGDRMYNIQPVRTYPIDLGTGVIGAAVNQGAPKLTNGTRYAAEYISFHAEDTSTASHRFAFIGSVRTNMTRDNTGYGGINGIVKTKLINYTSFDWSNTANNKHIQSFETDGVTRDRTDDQFAGVLGNLLFLCDEEDTYENDNMTGWGVEDGRKGCWFTQHRQSVDTSAPGLLAMRVGTNGHIGLSFNENVDIAKGAIAVRADSNPSVVISGTTATTNNTVVTWGPDSGSLPAGTYHVKVDLQDLAGNKVGNESPGFTTNLDQAAKRSYIDTTCHSSFGTVADNDAYCFSFSVP